MRFINEVQNGKNTAPLVDLFTPDAINHTAPDRAPHGIESMRSALQTFFDAFPDLSAEVELQIGEGDMVGTRKRFCGTHLGEFRGIPASGNRIDFAVMEFMEVRNGKITGHWGMVDTRALMAQIGGEA